MKLQNTLALGLGLILSQSAMAQTVSNPINEDLFFSNGVQIQDVTTISEGVATTTLEGTGSLTVGSQATGGFPRVSVSAGTTIKSTRAWPVEAFPKTSWDGQFTAPGSGRLPATDEIEFAAATNAGNQVQAVGAFVWGLNNETFSFTSPARFVFPVDEADGQRLWAATNTGSSWVVGSANNYCVVDSGLCYLELAGLNSLALVKQVYEVCPRETVLNGSVGSAPNCIVTCENNFFIDEEGDECLADEFASSAGGSVSSEAIGDSLSTETLTLDDLNESEREQLEAFAKEAGVDPFVLLREVVGQVKPRGTGEVERGRLLPELAEFTPEELEKVKLLNRSFYARNKRSTAEQIRGKGTDADERAKQDSFINYLLQIRNQFGDQSNLVSSENLAAQTEAVVTDQENEEVEVVADSFKSAGGKLLPQTGPGLFMIIAIVGFMLMLFGGIRRN